MNIICYLFDHNWRYNFPTMPSKRTCKRCGKIEINRIKPPISNKLFKWTELKTIKFKQKK